MRKIKYLIVHATGGWTHQTIADLNAEFKRKGWKHPGYHYVIKRDGSIAQLLDVAQPSNGCKGYNSVSINVAWIGGLADKKTTVDNRTAEQKTALRNLLKKLKKDYPTAEIRGHNFFDKGKACPCFDAQTEFSDL